MRILITDWALSSYSEFVPMTISVEEYWSTVRPDIERLFQFAGEQKFRDARFWGPAESGPNRTVPEGYKMKWHNIGNGGLQLRLGVTFFAGDAWLLHAWCKTSPHVDYINGATMRARIPRLRAGEIDAIGVIHERRS